MFFSAWVLVSTIIGCFVTITIGLIPFKENPDIYEGRLFKGNRNAIFLVSKGKKSLIPDFHTFSSMGFNISNIEKVPDTFISEIPLGDLIKPIAVYRPDDFMFHKQCDDADRMVKKNLSTIFLSLIHILLLRADRCKI